MILNRDFYIKDGITLAKDLLGKILVKEIDGVLYKGRIVETEAYMGAIDKACHAYNDRRTKRTEAMYREGGYSYIYLIYGMYHCFNVTASIKNNPEAVLIRALEPLDNKDIMLKIRKVKSEKYIANGPGKLTKALGIISDDNDMDLTLGKNIWIEDDGYVPNKITETTRVGIDYAEEFKDKPWRFYINENNNVSKK